MDSPKVKQEESEIAFVDTESSPERAQSSEHEHNGVDVDLIDFDSPLSSSDRVLHHDEDITFDLEFPLLDFGGPHTAQQPINNLLFDGEISPSGSAADSITCTISSSPVLSYCDQDSDFTPISSHRPFVNEQLTPTSFTSITCSAGDSLTPRPPRASPFGGRSAECTQDQDHRLIRYPLLQVDDEGRTYHVYSPHLSPLSPSPPRADLADSSEIRSITPRFDGDEGSTYHVYSPRLSPLSPSPLRANLSSEIRSITPHFDGRNSSPITSPFRRLTTISEELADPDATQTSRYTPARRPTIPTIHTISSHHAHPIACSQPSSLTPLEPLLLPYPSCAPHQGSISSSTATKRVHDPEDEDNESRSHKRHRGDPSDEAGDLLSWKFSLVPWKADLRIKADEISKSLSDMALESSKLMDERADIRKEIHNARQAELNGGLDFMAVHERLDQLSLETEAVQRRANSWRAISAYYLEKRSGLEQRVRRLETALRDIMNEIQPAL